MTNPMTPEQITAARALVDAATPGPVDVRHDDHIWSTDEMTYIATANRPADADFIAWCFNNARALLDALEAQTTVRVVVKPDRETFDAMCAMRDAINEYVPMPSLESDLRLGPENSVFCATVTEAVIAEVTRLRTIAEAAEAREAALLATNETERQTLVRHNAAHAAQVADLTTKLDKALQQRDVWMNRAMNELGENLNNRASIKAGGDA